MRKKKLISWKNLILCLCMLVSVFPFTYKTYAAEISDSEKIQIVDKSSSGYQKTKGGPLAVVQMFHASPTLSTRSQNIVGDGYIFDQNTGTITINTIKGVSNWQADKNIAVNEADRLAAIKTAILTEDVTEFGGDGFSSCPNLTTLSISSKMVDYWGTDPLMNCPSLTKIDVAEDNPKYKSIDGALYDKVKHEMIRCPEGKQGSFTVPEGIIVIRKSAFYNCKDLTSITLPGSVELLKSGSLSECTNLSELYFTGDKAPTVENNVFENLPSQGTLFHIAGVPGFDSKNFGESYLALWERKSIGTLPNVIGDIVYANQPWWVIGYNGEGIHSQKDTITLLHKKYLATTSFDTASNRQAEENNQYGGSLLQAEMEKFYKTITPQEQSLILPQTLNSVRIDNNYSATLDGLHPIWPLSYEEAILLPSGIRNLAGPWWLRSTRMAYSSVNYFHSTLQADLFTREGNIQSSHVNNVFGIRPAVTLKLDSVLMASDALNGKPAPGSDLQDYHKPAGTTKLTIIDDTTLSLNTSTNQITAESGSTINIPYTKATIGVNHSVSVIIKDKNTDAILYYGRPVNCETSNSGTASFKLPENLADGEYNLLVFNEQVNDENMSDFASTPIVLDLKVGIEEDPKPIDPDKPSYTKKTLTDDSGVRVSGMFSDDAVLEVKKLQMHKEGTCPVCDDIRLHQNKGELIALYDIVMKSGMYEGDLIVEIPVDEKFNGQKVLMMHCKDSIADNLELTISDGCAKGTFTSLSPFAVALKAKNIISISGLPESHTLSVGQSVNWTPAPANGNWSYDKDFLEMTQQDGTYTFKALKAGKTTATYTVEGAAHTITITIDPSTLETSPNTPNTSDINNSSLWILLMVVSLLGCFIMITNTTNHIQKHHE